MRAKNVKFYLCQCNENLKTALLLCAVDVVSENRTSHLLSES